MRYAKTVKCIVSTIPDQLTYGHEYMVFGETEGGYQVADKHGTINSYKKYMFEVVEWESE